MDKDDLILITLQRMKECMENGGDFDEMSAIVKDGAALCIENRSQAAQAVRHFHEQAWSDSGASLELQRVMADLLLTAVDAAENGGTDIRKNPVVRALGLGGRADLGLEHTREISIIEHSMVVNGLTVGKALQQASIDHPDIEWPDERTMTRWINAYAVFKDMK